MAAQPDLSLWGSLPAVRAENAIPPAVRVIQLVNARPYDAEDRLLYDMNDTVTGDRLEPLVQRCLQDPRTHYVNIHIGRPGCFLCRVEAI